MILSTVENRILDSLSRVESSHLLKVAAVESSYENKISFLKEECDFRINELQSRLDTCVRLRDETSEKIQNEKLSLESQLVELHSRLDELAAEKNIMEEKAKLTENKVGVLNEVKRRLVEYTKTLEERIQASDKQTSETDAEKNNSLKRVEELVQENASLRENLSSLNTKIDALLIEKSQHDKKFSELQNEHSRLSDVIGNVRKEKEALEAQHADCALQRDNLEDSVTTLQRENQELSARVRALEDQLRTLGEQRDHLQGLCEMISKEKAAIEALKNDLEENLVLKESDSMSKKFKNDELLDINGALKGDIELLNSSLKDLEVDKDRLNKEIENLKYVIAEVKEENKSSAEDLEQKLFALETAEEEKKNLMTSNDDLKKMNENVLQEKQNLEHKLGLQEVSTSVEALLKDITNLKEEKEAITKKYEEEHHNLLEMQNMMVSDLEKLILSLEAEKNNLADSNDSLTVKLKTAQEENSYLTTKANDKDSSMKYLQEKLQVLENEKAVLAAQSSQLRGVLERLQTAEDESQGATALKITEDLMGQTKDLQQKLLAAQEALSLKESEYLEKVKAERGDLDQLSALRKDMTEELDIIESRKDEESEQLEEKFAHLEVEFTTKLAETKEYYESLLLDEKAEFGRVLVTKVAEYEKRLSEKCDEISGWEVKLMSMQEELDGKMIVIEELEERLEERSCTPRQKDDSPATFSPPTEASLHPSVAALREDALHRLTPLQEMSESPTPSMLSASCSGDMTEPSTPQYPAPPPPFSSSIPSSCSIPPTQPSASHSDQVPVTFCDLAATDPCTFATFSSALPHTTNNSSDSFVSSMSDIPQGSVFSLSTFDKPHTISAVPNDFGFMENDLIFPKFIEPPFVDFTQAPNVSGNVFTMHDACHPPYPKGNTVPASPQQHSVPSTFRPYEQFADPRLYGGNDTQFAHGSFELPSSKSIPSSKESSSCIPRQPILSLVIPSTFSDMESQSPPSFSPNRETAPEKSTYNTNAATMIEPISEQILIKPDDLSVSTDDDRRGPVKTAVFVSRDFPSDATLHQTIVSALAFSSPEKPSGFSNSVESQDDDAVCGTDAFDDVISFLDTLSPSPGTGTSSLQPIMQTSAPTSISPPLPSTQTSSEPTSVSSQSFVNTDPLSSTSPGLPSSVSSTVTDSTPPPV